jgi:O-antigen ligase
MDTVERFLRLVGDYPWQMVWLAIFVLFVLAVISRMRAGGAVLAVVALVVIVLVLVLRPRERPPVTAPVAPVTASHTEQASRPSPYDEQEPVQDSRGGLQ